MTVAPTMVSCHDDKRTNGNAYRRSKTLRAGRRRCSLEELMTRAVRTADLGDSPARVRDLMICGDYGRLYQYL
ncbi:hypothetical protein [Roseiflexus castenholzii]|uniref:hypothetical protein n=1 Tax=Roseiflexus castenholzii TaxID=120962 RepID=UPI003C7B6CE9